MLVNVRLILTIICSTLADRPYRDQEYTPNVGTVLFSANDIEKNQWTKSEISLLRARRYFQTIIPPLDIINSFNEDYVNVLLDYFRDTYSNIKREATDLDTDSIMTTALSDVLGGYLKVWVLPVAKLDYYGGTISQDNIVKLFLFYDEIKEYLCTDGEGWHCPDEDVLNSLNINIAPIKLTSSTRSIKDPCDQLAYFEKTSTGLDIPLPKVNWNSKASTLFVPLKNMTLIPMTDPCTANTLVKYYEIARSCITATDPAQLKNFETRFQNWLSDNILPHLKDENVYLALGSVLALVNKTDSFGNKIMCATNDECHIKIKSKIRLPFEITSKKMMIMFIILLLEVAWCIPALVYIICTKRKRDCSSNVYLYIDQSKSDKRDKSLGKKPKTTKNVSLDPRSTCFKTSKETEVQNPSTPYCPCETTTSTPFYTQHVVTDMSVQCPSTKITIVEGTGSRSYFTSKNQCCEATDIEKSNVPKKSSLKKAKNIQAQPSCTAKMTSISHEDRPELSPKGYPIEEPKKPPPKRSSRSKESKLIAPSKRNENVKEVRNVSSVHRSTPVNSDQSKDVKRTAPYKQNDPRFESKTGSLNQNDSIQHSKASLRKSSTQDTRKDTNQVPENNTTQISKPTLVKQNQSNKSLKSASSSKRSKDMISGSYSFTKMSSGVDIDRFCEVVEVHSMKEILKSSEPKATNVNEPKIFVIDEELFNNNNRNNVSPTCPCTGCFIDSEHDETEREIRVENFNKPDIKPLGKTEEVMLADPCFVDAVPQTSREHTEKISTKKASFKVTDSGKPFFEITIDRPATEINVDVTGTEQPATYIAPFKRSKIPKPNTTVTHTLLPKVSEHSGDAQVCLPMRAITTRKVRSLIPQPKKKTVDDSALQRGCTCTITRDKLNDTF